MLKLITYYIFFQYYYFCLFLAYFMIFLSFSGFSPHCSTTEIWFQKVEPLKKAVKKGSNKIVNKPIKPKEKSEAAKARDEARSVISPSNFIGL